MQAMAKLSGSGSCLTTLAMISPYCLASSPQVNGSYSSFVVKAALETEVSNHSPFLSLMQHLQR